MDDLALRARNLVAFYADLPEGDHLAWLEEQVRAALADVREEARRAGREAGIEQARMVAVRAAERHDRAWNSTRDRPQVMLTEGACSDTAGRIAAAIAALAETADA